MTNPYVGPRPFQTGEALFGRDSEVSQLRYLLTSQRIVLLYSPSGAGKSSVVNAGLIPRMAGRFDIWGPTRVNAEAPVGAGNRYVWSAISGFSKADAALGQTLSEYAASRVRENNPLLIFDQFEEILRIDPAGTAEKTAFFRQLGDLLADPTVWALFVLREDYLAPLDPNVRLLPTQFQNRFRIDRLTRATATETIVKPLEGTGVRFAEKVAETLADNLATEKSEYVEPLQLQVVCFDLRERMEKAGKSVIEAGDLADVSSALRNYYDRAVARDTEPEERDIREWFDTKLILPDGVRNQVRHEEKQTGGLETSVVLKLLDSYLVRAEPRGGIPWYELSHDRMVAPVRSSNAEWFEKHLKPVQKLAKTWAAQGQPLSMRLLGPELIEAQRWAHEQAALTEDEKKFLDASVAAQADADEKAGQAKRIRRFLTAALCFLVLALGAGGYATFEAFKISAQKHIFDSSRLASAADVALSEHGEFPLAALLSVEAQKAKSTTDSLGALLRVSQYEPRLLGVLPDSEMGATLSPDGKTVAVVEKDHTVRLWEVKTLKSIGQPLRGHTGLINAVAFSTDSSALATASNDGTVRVWNLKTRQGKPLWDPGVRELAFSPNGKTLATAADGVRFWDVEGGVDAGFLPSTEQIARLAFSPDGKSLAATALLTNKLSVWDVGERSLKPYPSLPGFEIAFSPDGKMLALGDSSGVHFADSATGAKIGLPLVDPKEPLVVSVAFSADGRGLVSVSSKGTVESWRLDTGEAIARILSSRDKPALRSSFSRDGTVMASTTVDQSVRLWNLSGFTEADGGNGTGIRIPEPAGNAALSPDAKTLATISSDYRKVQFWNTETWKETGEVPAPASLSALAISNGGAMAFASPDGTLNLWNESTGKADGEPLSGSGVNVGGLVFSPDGQMLAIVSNQPEVSMRTPGSFSFRLWDLKGRRLLTDSPSNIQGLVFSQDSIVFVTISDAAEGGPKPKGQKLEVWDLKPSPHSIAQLALGKDSEKILAISADGSVVALGRQDDTVQLLDGKSLKSIGQPIRVDKSVLWALAFSMDGQLLATGTDEAVQLWDVQTQEEVGGIIPVDGGAGSKIAFNGKSLVWIGKSPQSWSLDPDYLVAFNCRRANRNLTVAEWKHYMGEGTPYRKTCPAVQ